VIRIALVLVTVGCFSSSPARRERTTLSDDSAAIMLSLRPHDPAEDDASTKARFQQHYDAAMTAYKDASYANAIAEFEASYAIDPQPLLIFNIAQSYRKAGKLDTALAKYREYLDRDPSAERDRVGELIKQTEGEVARRQKTKPR
jgi:tetratricopeptide (TPR) repeat protein